MGSAYTTNNCCFCISLKTGSLIILWLYLLSGVSWMLSPTISGGYKRNGTIEISSFSDTQIAHITEYGMDGFLLKDTSSILDFLSTPYAGSSWISTAIASINVVVAVLGLYGLYKENPSFLKPYLVWELVDFLIIFILFIRYWITVNINVGAALYVVIFGYFWIVVYSYYKLTFSSVPSVSTIMTA